MEFSLGKTLWRIYLKLLGFLIWSFFFLDIAFFVYILYSIDSNFKEVETLFVSLTVVFSIGSLATVFSVWIQGLYLALYFKFSYSLIIYLLSSGNIDYNVVWSLPDIITNIIGTQVGGQYSDFVFWSGAVLSILFLVDRFERQLIVFLVNKLKIEWARELLEERAKDFSKTKKIREGIIETDSTGGVSDDQINPVLCPKESMERVYLKPKFFKDRLWYQLLIFSSFVLPLIILPFLFRGGSGTYGSASGPLFWVFGGTFLSIFLICSPFFLWEVTTRIILEKDKMIVRSFFFIKTVIFYSEVKRIDVRINEGLKIHYEKKKNNRSISKIAYFFPWSFTSERLLTELKCRLKNIDISEEFIAGSLKTIRAARGYGTIITVIVTTGLLVGFLYFIIFQIENRTKFSDEDCALRLDFWVGDRSKIGTLETKEGFYPRLNINSPFYFFINGENSGSDCDKIISFVVYDTAGNIFSQKSGMKPPKTGVVSYRWDNLFKEKGEYLLKVNYETTSAKKIDFSVGDVIPK